LPELPQFDSSAKPVQNVKVTRSRFIAFLRGAQPLGRWTDYQLGRVSAGK
jgi:hypothetical protein